MGLVLSLLSYSICSGTSFCINVSIVAVTNNHKHNGLKNTNLLPYSFASQKSNMDLTGQKSGVSRSAFLLGTLAGLPGLCFLDLPSSRGRPHSLACGLLLSSSKPAASNFFGSAFIPMLLLMVHRTDWPTWITQDDLPSQSP